MQDTDVLILGGGPIGLTASLLLSRLGVRTILVDRRAGTSRHPRSRLVDRRTLEILRQVGVESEIQRTGLPPEWTGCIRFLESLSGREIARIESPSFHGVPAETSPSWPVMTSQDAVEAILYEHACAQDEADVRFGVEAIGLAQDDAGCRVSLRRVADGRESTVAAPYVIAADGVRSPTRDWIASPLGGDTIDVFFQDVLFHADLSKWVGERKGGLLFIAHATGAAVFQPLDGLGRWRAQIGNLDPDDEVNEAFCKDWIRSAAGTEEAFDIRIESIRPWQFVAGVAERFRRGRVFLAGDAAHALIPTGGLGNNTGFAGIHNLAWKLAWVVQGHASPALLDSYEAEHGPIAATRVATSLDISVRAAGLFAAHARGGDVAAAAARASRYPSYEGLILGFEHVSPLCIPDPTPPPAPEDAVRDFVPVIRGGRRAPHVRVEDGRSVLDAFGAGYVVLADPGPEGAGWRRVVEAVRAEGVPIRALPLPESGPYRHERAVVVRPDGIVAAHEPRSRGPEPPSMLLDRCLPC